MLAERHKVASGRIIVHDTTQRRPVCLLIVRNISNMLLLVQTHGTWFSRAIDPAYGAGRWTLLHKVGP
jgi:hypothetical protein